MKFEYKYNDEMGAEEVSINGIVIGYVYGDGPARYDFEWKSDYNLGKIDSGLTYIKGDSKGYIEGKIKSTIRNIISELRGMVE